MNDPLDAVHKILVLRPNAVGDFVYALPCLHALRKAYPNAHIAYIGKQWHADFLADRPGPVDEIVVLPPCPGLGAAPDARLDMQPIAACVRGLQSAEFDLALQIFGGGRYSNPFIKRLGARLTVGMKAPDAEPLDRWVHYGPLQNRRLQLLEVAALVGAGCAGLERELQITERDRREAAQVLPHEAGKPLVLLQPGATDPRRRWGAARFAAVGDILAGAGARIAVNGSAQEAPLVQAVIAEMRQPAINLAGTLSLCGLCGLLDRSALLVSNDTGPLHLALALGTPSVGIYWLTNLLEAAPLRQHAHRAALSVRIRCPVCDAENLNTRCEHDASFVDEVSLEEVAALAMELYPATPVPARQRSSHA